MKKGSGKTAKAKRRIRVRPKRPSAKLAGLAGNAVFLVGFMGAGKSSVGRALGQRLNWIFEDLDDRIEAREGRTVAEIFRDSGESEFRRAEHAALQHVLEELRGGGRQNRCLGRRRLRAERKCGAAESIAACPRFFWTRRSRNCGSAVVRRQRETGTERPLLRSMEQFRKLYETRRKSYSKASLKIQTGSRAVETIAAEIAKALGLKKIALRTEQGEVE